MKTYISLLSMSSNTQSRLMKLCWRFSYCHFSSFFSRNWMCCWMTKRVSLQTLNTKKISNNSLLCWFLFWFKVWTLSFLMSANNLSTLSPTVSPCLASSFRPRTFKKKFAIFCRPISQLCRKPMNRSKILKRLIITLF